MALKLTAEGLKEYIKTLCETHIVLARGDRIQYDRIGDNFIVFVDEVDVTINDKDKGRSYDYLIFPYVRRENERRVNLSHVRQ